MTEHTHAPTQPTLPSLDGLPDDALRDVIGRARNILEQRQAERRKTALEQIRRLARENGLDISVTKPKARRGRPPRATE